MHRGDAGRTNRFPYRNALEETLRVSWSHGLDGNSLNRPPAPVFDAKRVFVAPEFGRAVALDRQRGTPVWRDSKRTGHETPAVGDETVVLATDDSIRGLDKATGSERWSHGRDVRGAPVLHDGVVFDGTRGFDVDDGSVRLRLDDDDSFVVPTVGGGRVYLGSGRRVTAYDVESGTVAWETRDLLDQEWIEDEAFVYADERLYVPGVDGLVALDAATGEKLWEFVRPEWNVYRTPSVVNGTVVQPMSHRYGDGSRIVQFDASDGTERWEYRPPRPRQSDVEAVATTPGTVLAMYHDHLACLDVHSGEPLFATRLDGVFERTTPPYVTGPFAYDGRRLIVAGDARTVALETGGTRIESAAGVAAGGGVGAVAALAAYWRSGRS